MRSPANRTVPPVALSGYKIVWWSCRLANRRSLLKGIAAPLSVVTRDVTRRRLLAGAATALTAVAGCSATTPFVGKRRELTRRVDPAGASTLSIDGALGDIRVHSTDRDDVRIDAVKQSSSVRSDIEQLDLSVATTGGTVRLRSEWSGTNSLLSSPPSLSMDVAVPRSIRLERVLIEDGDITVRELAGDPVLRTATGDVAATDISGTVTARSDTGDVTVRDPAAIGDLRTDTGDVVADVPAIDGTTRVESQTGDVEVALSPGLDARLDATTDTGEIAVTGRSFGSLARTDRTPGSTLAGTLGDGGPRLGIETETGDITVAALENPSQASSSE